MGSWIERLGCYEALFPRATALAPCAGGCTLRLFAFASPRFLRNPAGADRWLGSVRLRETPLAGLDACERVDPVGEVGDERSSVSAGRPALGEFVRLSNMGYIQCARVAAGYITGRCGHGHEACQRRVGFMDLRAAGLRAGEGDARLGRGTERRERKARTTHRRTFTLSRRSSALHLS